MPMLSPLPPLLGSVTKFGEVVSGKVLEDKVTLGTFLATLGLMSGLAVNQKKPGKTSLENSTGGLKWVFWMFLAWGELGEDVSQVDRYLAKGIQNTNYYVILLVVS